MRYLTLPAAASALLFWMLPAGANEDAMPLNMASLYEDEPEVAIDYAVAMSIYRRIGEGERAPRRGYPLIRAGEALPRAAFTWFAEDGGMIERLESGSFRLSRASHPGNWFYTTICIVAEWPALLCDDGQVREISAPDTETVLLAGKTYRRSIRTTEQAIEEQGD